MATKEELNYAERLRKESEQRVKILEMEEKIQRNLTKQLQDNMKSEDTKTRLAAKRVAQITEGLSLEEQLLAVSKEKEQLHQILFEFETTSPLLKTLTYIQHGRQETSKENRQRWRQDVFQEEGRDLQDLHLQGLEASAPGHRHLLQGDEHHELLHQRHL